MPMFHAYCQNSAEHAKLANQVSISMNKTLKPSLRARCRFYEYIGSGHYYYFINPIRVVSFIQLDNPAAGHSPIGQYRRYSGELRRDYVYSDDEYNEDIFAKELQFELFVSGFRGERVDGYKKSFFRHIYSEVDRYKYDGVYINDVDSAVVNGRGVQVLMLKAGLKAGDIVSIDNRECFLIADYYSIWAIAID